MSLPSGPILSCFCKAHLKLVRFTQRFLYGDQAKPCQILRLLTRCPTTSLSRCVPQGIPLLLAIMGTHHTMTSQLGRACLSSFPQVCKTMPAAWRLIAAVSEAAWASLSCLERPLPCQAAWACHLPSSCLAACSLGRVPCLHNTLATQMHLHLAGVHILYLPSAAGLNLSILLCNFRLTSWHGKWQTPDHIVSRCGHSGLH